MPKILPPTAEPRLPEIAPSTRLERWTLGTLTAALLALVAFWAVFTPLYDAPDEPLHMNSGVRLAMGGGWPDPGDASVTMMILAAAGESAIPAEDRSSLAQLQLENPGYGGVDQMTQHPPLYYAYVAAVLDAVDFMDIRADHALLLARLAGLIFVLPMPFFVWDSVRRVTGSARAGLLGAAALFAVPQLAHIMGAVSNDSMVIAFSTATVWLGIRVMTGDRSWWTTTGIGISLALALLTKGTAVPLVAYVAIVMLMWPRSAPARWRAFRALVALGIGFVGGGWWWARNLLVFGALQPAGLVYEANPWPAGTGPSIGYFIEQLWVRVSVSFWGNFGWLTHPLPTWMTDPLTVICIAVVIGYAFRRSPVRLVMLAQAALVIVFLLALIYQTWPSYVRSQLPAGMQGRYFFTVILALIVLSAVAWRNLLPAIQRTTTCLALPCVFAFVAMLAIWVEYRAVYAGFADWMLRTPIGTLGTAAIVGATGLACAAALVLTMRSVVRHPAVA